MKVGSLVECVATFDDNQTTAQSWGVRFPIVRNIYTIRDFVTIDGEDFLRLEEIVNPEIPYLDGNFGEICFDVEAFRELLPPQSINLEELLREEQTV